MDDPQKLTGRLVISIDEANKHQDNGYYLVGNPYMSSLYMKRFFDQNTQLYPKYWTMQNGQMCAFDASADNVVAPMTAFFVKPVSGTLLQNIEFLPIMTVPFTSAVTQSAEATLRLTLTSGSHTTSASIVADKGAAADFKEGEDVEAMFDSNTTGSALTLYTMAGQLARLDAQIKTMIVLREQVMNQTYGMQTTLLSASSATPDIWPVKGQVSSSYGFRASPGGIGSTYHEGLDIAADYGAPVSATASGTVTRAGWVDGYGYLVEVKHDGDITTRYGHNSAILVTEGQQVEQGTILALVGSTGNSTGPHCHYEVRIHGDAVDPTYFLPGND